MFAQVTFTAFYDPPMVRQKVLAQMGATAVPPVFALKGTRYAAQAYALAPTVIAAQSIRDAALILYFFDGPDTITVHIAAESIADIKAQTQRVTRQLLPLLKKGKKVVKVAILAAGGPGITTPIMNGARISLLRQASSVAADKGVSKLLVPALVFGLTSNFLVGTPAVESALYGLVAASLAFLIEVALFVYHGDEWKWEEVP